MLMEETLMIDDVRAENEQKWQKATNKVIADDLVKNIEKLLGGKSTYYVCSDLKTMHKKIVIEYDHEVKCNH